MGKNSCWQPDESSTLHQNSRRKSKCETPSLHSYQNLADDYMEQPLNDLPLLAKSLMRKYWLGRSWIERQRCLAALSFQQYAGNWIIKSTLMESWEYCGLSFFFPSPSSKGLTLISLTGTSWGYRVHRDGSGSFCCACPSLYFAHVLLLRLSRFTPPSLSGFCLAFSSLSLTLTHAVSKQTVLSRSISGCHAVDQRNKIKNRAREREIFPSGLRIEET